LECIPLDENLQQMQQGMVMRKVKSRSWKKQRYFMLQDDCMTIWYKSRKTGNAKSACECHLPAEGHSPHLPTQAWTPMPPDSCFGHRTRPMVSLVVPASALAFPLNPKADKNRDGRMNFKEVQHLLKMMNVDMDEHHAFRLFQMADKSESGTLEGEEFVLFYKALTQRDEVLSVFQEFSEDGKKLTLLEFVDFLQQEQMEGEGVEELAMELIAKYEPSETAKARHVLSIDGFLAYLCSPDGCIFNPTHKTLFQDMSQPLCHYFISSSHNTYLIEDQLRGQSSIEGYIRALKRGCRCLEVDCWDGPNGEPIVYHGHTFTSKIPFREVISTLEKYAFQASEYPVVLSLENHCSMEQQDVMAQQLKGILGEQLLTTTIDGRVPARMPSPEELKGKILLKGKRLGSLEDALSGEPEEKSKPSLSKELSDCIVYCKSVSFHSFQHSQSHYRLYEMSSFAEAKARKLIREAGNEFVRHNAWQLTRIYPSGMRTDSSNYNPQEMWNVGCQMVALNFQTAGAEMDLYDGLFNQNGSCGYVLKPGFLRDVETPFSPESLPQSNPLYLAIQVISGQQLPKVVNSKEGSIVDPLVRVEIHGVPADTSKQETKYIDNNGFNPQWGETLRFRVQVPELALLRFKVEDYDKTSRNDFVGQFTLPLSSVKRGYRHIHLLSKDGTAIPPASLFVHVQITELSESD
uniref:Phosphoinositide phospholipase C n=1 Tax=Sphenodon punctatus TaxID=8508 RepID=A0A8D0H9E1_SPHPU